MKFDMEAAIKSGKDETDRRKQYMQSLSVGDEVLQRCSIDGPFSGSHTDWPGSVTEINENFVVVAGNPKFSDKIHLYDKVTGLGQEYEMGIVVPGKQS